MNSRYFLDHGMIHDRNTGRHITTDDTMQRGGTLEVLALLNEYEAAQPVATVRRMMARLAELLDEDQFAEIERIALDAGIEPPAQPVAQPVIGNFDLGVPMRPLYYVRHPDDTYSIANPQPAAPVAQVPVDDCVVNDKWGNDGQF